jgi:zinc protease
MLAGQGGIVHHRKAVFLLLVAATASVAAQQPPANANVTRATLDNGLRVVVIRDPLAPVVTVEQNYLVGADETPPTFPGMAHAQEHMAFRGCTGLSGDQISAIYAQLGGYGNADTQQNITQYFTTVQAADLDIALRVDAACMQDIEDSQAEWSQEKGAIEQEVARDLSEPTYKFITRLNEDMFSGTPYAHDALGTRESFEATTGDMLKKFYRDWYAPNNAILVVAGDVNPQAVMATIRDLYGRIGRRTLPPRPEIALKPVKPDTFTLDSDLPYVLAFIAYRLPGSDSPDFAPAQVLADVLASQRGNLYALVPEGKALAAEFEIAETYPKASVGFSLGALPVGTDPAAIVSSMRAILGDYARTGVPTELVDAAKRNEIAGAEFERNSIPGLAAAWSEALAGKGRNSPDEDVEAIRRVTVAEVDRVAKQYLTVENSITATLVPSPSGQPASSKGFGGSEQITSAPSQPVQLPDWAESRLAAPPQIPQQKASWTDITLPNKVRLIVKPDATSPTITVLGQIRHEPKLETPPGKDGVDDILGDLFSYGTTTLDRLAFQKALDDISATEKAGTDFSVRVLKGDLSRGVELVADNVLHPALPAEAFDIVKAQTTQYVAGQLKSPGYRAERALALGLLPPNDPKLRETTPQTIGAVTLADVKAYHARVFRPDLATIVVIGDVTAEDARATIKKWFGGWPATGPTPNVVLPRVPPNKPSMTAVPDPSQVQDSVTLAQQVQLTRFDPDYYALQLGEHVLGGGFYATRFYHDLRQVAGYVYTVDDSFIADRTRATYTVSYGSDPQNVGKARALIERDLKTMQTDLVTPAELRQARALLIRQIWLRESSENAVAQTLLGRAEIGLPLNESVRGTTRYLAITAEEIRAAFKKWVRPNAFVQVVQGPPTQ